MDGIPGVLLQDDTHRQPLQEDRRRDGNGHGQKGELHTEEGKRVLAVPRNGRHDESLDPEAAVRQPGDGNPYLPNLELHLEDGKGESEEGVYHSKIYR